MKFFYKIFLSIFVFFLMTSFSFAYDLSGKDKINTHHAKVVKVLKEEMRENIISNTHTIYQIINAEILDGQNSGKVIEIENDFQKLKEGDKFFYKETIGESGDKAYWVVGVDRKGALLLLFAIFVAVIIFFGKWQGVRSLLSLAGSFLIISFVLLPGILNGWNPLFASFFVAFGILFMAIFFTHGFNKESTVAFSGTMIAVLLSGLFALFAVKITSLSGFATEEAVFLNMDANVTINFTALLLGAFIIGFLGILDDIAITQAAVVSELFNSNKDISKWEVYKRAMRVGRDHVGALVNTLVLAYTGGALPVLLYLKLGNMEITDTVNLEIFATEIVRTIVGSVGLILTVPITTLLAIKYLKGYKTKHENSHFHHY